MCKRPLLGKSPKDFDVATDAHPDRIKSLFNSARIVGRRFQIVHVRFGRDIIEVTTFRAPAQDEGSVTEGGMLLSDNVYGNYEQDVMRRDFTMNALYYDAENDEVRDLVNGRNDIDDRVIRLIGDPEVRFREDPVRMLRAARFEAKLGFEIDPTAAEAIHRLGHMLQEIPPARLFEEALKLFMSGHGEASFESLCRHNLTGWLFPNYAKPAEEADIRSEGQAHTLIKLALASTDNRIREGLPVTPAFVLAALLWWPYLAEQRRLKEWAQPNSRRPMNPLSMSLPNSSSPSQYQNASALQCGISGTCKRGCTTPKARNPPQSHDTSDLELLTISFFCGKPAERT